MDEEQAVFEQLSLSDIEIWSSSHERPSVTAA